MTNSLRKPPVERVAFLTIHTTPLAQPGIGDAGGMNVYVDELARTIAGRGVAVDVFTRASAQRWPDEVEVRPGYRVINLEAGPRDDLAVSELAPWVDSFASGVIRRSEREGLHYDVVHSHYWLSGWAGILVKDALGIPLANSFHTLGRVKDASRRPGEPPESLLRIAAEKEVIERSDCVIASTPAEFDDLLEHYGADPAKLCVSPPGVDHQVFRPGSKEEARRFLGLADEPLLLFVGRIQPLKGLGLAVEALELLADEMSTVRLLVVGGPSGSGGIDELDRIRSRVEESGLRGRVKFISPQPHHSLASFYQAADLLIVPSRSESFGLVAVEAQACGLPVVAARVGGLAHVVSDGESGVLIDGHDPASYAKAALEILRDQQLAIRLSKGALEVSEQFSWDVSGDRMLELYGGITGSD